MSVKITFHGQSNIEIHSGPHAIQLDPFYNNNPLSDVRADAVSPQFILLSHAHFDHVDDAAPIAQRTGAIIISNYEIAGYFEKKKLRTQAMNYGGGFDFPFGRATFTLAFHTSSFADGSNGGLPGGWIIETGGKIIYFAGDTALFGDMALIGKLWNIDLACLPIGDCFTMGPAHAILAAEMLRAKCVLPIHYNTFPQIKQDPVAFAANLKKQKGIDCMPIQPGQSFVL